MKTILFQGDSITDASRSREYEHYNGNGYATLVSASLGYARPGEFQFINRGVSGNRTSDILARIKPDILNLTPDYMSILIGVNDVWHELANHNGVDNKYFEIYYDLIISQVIEALPDTKIMILEPFALQGEATKEKFDEFITGVKDKAAISKKIADKYNITFVPLMDKFNEAASKAYNEYWLWDGVHPTAMGHELIKNEWLRAFESIEK